MIRKVSTHKNLTPEVASDQYRILIRSRKIFERRTRYVVIQVIDHCSILL